MTLNKNVREKVMNVLNTIEERGGKDALEVIRQKIPTYTSIYMWLYMYYNIIAFNL